MCCQEGTDRKGHTVFVVKNFFSNREIGKYDTLEDAEMAASAAGYVHLCIYNALEGWYLAGKSGRVAQYGNNRGDGVNIYRI